MVLFEGWHNERYLKQCYYNLQEKYDCGGISKEEWMKVYKYVNFVLDLRLDDEKIIFKKRPLDFFKKGTQQVYYW